MKCWGRTSRDLVALVWDGNDCRALRAGGLMQVVYRLTYSPLPALGFPMLEGWPGRAKADAGWTA